MKCFHCNFLESEVIDSRLNAEGDITRRRRKCPNCDSRWTTWETAIEPGKDFDRATKALAQLRKARLTIDMAILEAEKVVSNEH